MRIPRVNLFLPLCMALVIGFLCFVCNRQERVIEAQRVELWKSADAITQLTEELQVPCEERPSFQDNKRNQTVLAGVLR